MGGTFEEGLGCGAGVPATAPPARRTRRRQTQAGLGASTWAVAMLRGQTTSNSPPCHWLTAPGVPTFSLPLKRMRPTIVLCSVLAT